MLRRHKNLIGIALIIVFAFGGIAGPLVHRVDHSADIDTAQQAAHEHEHDKDGVSLFADASSLLPDCELCKPLLYESGQLRYSSDWSPLQEALHLNTSTALRTTDWSNLRARAPPAIA